MTAGGTVVELDLNEIRRTPTPRPKRSWGRRLLVALVCLAIWLALVWFLFIRESSDNASDSSWDTATPIAADGSQALVVCDDPTGDVEREQSGEVGPVTPPGWIDATNVNVAMGETELVVQWTLAGEPPTTAAGYAPWSTSFATWGVALNASELSGYEGEARFIYVDADFKDGQFAALVEGEGPGEATFLSDAGRIAVDGKVLTATIGIDALADFPPEFVVFASSTADIGDGESTGHWAMTDPLCGEVVAGPVVAEDTSS